MTPLAPGVPSGRPERIAVVGAGVSGLTAAYVLGRSHGVTLFEAEPRLGGHAHTHTVPDDTYGGKSHIEKKWGTTFINVAELTQHHGVPENQVPRSWLLTFTDGSDKVRAQCYLHADNDAPQGWYDKVDSTIKLPAPFRMGVGR